MQCNHTHITLRYAHSTRLLDSRVDGAIAKHVAHHANKIRYTRLRYTIHIKLSHSALLSSGTEAGKGTLRTCRHRFVMKISGGRATQQRLLIHASIINTSRIACNGLCSRGGTALTSHADQHAHTSYLMPHPLQLGLTLKIVLRGDQQSPLPGSSVGHLELGWLCTGSYQQTWFRWILLEQF